MSERSTRISTGHSAKAKVSAGSTKLRRLPSGSSANGTRLVAQHRVGKIARQQGGDQEGEQCDGKQDRQQVKQPPSDELRHGLGPSIAEVRVVAVTPSAARGL